MAPMFSTAVILYPRRSNCRSLRGFVNCGECWISSAVIFISYNLSIYYRENQSKKKGRMKPRKNLKNDAFLMFDHNCPKNDLDNN